MKLYFALTCSYLWAQENAEHVTDLSITRRSTSFTGSDSIRAQVKDSHFLQGGDKGAGDRSTDASPLVQVLPALCPLLVDDRPHIKQHAC